MLRKIYKKHKARKVSCVLDHEKDILTSIRPLSMSCKEGVFLIEEELESNDPDLDERCGLLADRYEVYAIRIPGCKSHALAVSIDWKSDNTPPAIIHGAVASRGACKSARILATKQLALIDPSWE